jgi:divalent metal cation (Fe/Co/Zn/Cd) transporter
MARRGKDRHAGLHEGLRDSLTAADVERAVSRIEKAIKANHPNVSRVFIEAQSFEAHLRSLEAQAVPTSGNA